MLEDTFRAWTLRSDVDTLRRHFPSPALRLQSPRVRGPGTFAAVWCQLLHAVASDPESPLRSLDCVLTCLRGRRSFC